ncbi:TPA: hypothetical protein ACGU4W_003760 [Vibrio vulnificus]
MTELVKRLQEVIAVKPNKIETEILMKVVRQVHPQATLSEASALLHKALHQLVGLQVITLPNRRLRSAWAPGAQLPIWVLRARVPVTSPIFQLNDNDKAPPTTAVIDKSSIYTLPREQLKQVRDRAPWVGKMLAIGPSLKLDAREIDKALRVNEYLRNRQASVEPIPVRERALQILGGEKKLDSSLKTGLFRGHIDVQRDLDCFFVTEPLQNIRIPPEPVNGPILIIENSTTFYSAWKANSVNLIYSAVIFGRGNMLTGNELACDSIEEVRQELAERAGTKQLPAIEYFGDADPIGFHIPVRINVARATAGLDLIKPAVAMYEKLVTFSKQPSEHEWPKSLKYDAVKEWLGDELSFLLGPVFEGKYRWAQEWMTQDELTSICQNIRSEHF